MAVETAEAEALASQMAAAEALAAGAGMGAMVVRAVDEANSVVLMLKLQLLLRVWAAEQVIDLLHSRCLASSLFRV